MDHFVAGIVFDQLVEIGLRQILIYLLIRCKLRNILEAMSWTTAKDNIIEILCTQFILGHDSP